MENLEIGQLKKISELNNESFYIPAYQRGYKWDSVQVQELLDDIEEFVKDYPEDNSERIYCVQPLVVKARKNSDEKIIYNVVDGQQRLTTIRLILASLGSEIKYEIEYQTREGSKDFITKDCLTMKEHSGENSDFFHMYKVKDKIDTWLEDKLQDKNFDMENFKNTLEKKVCFIWYPISGNETEAAVFRRINEGKIPHTQAEQIKGLFLNSYNYSAFVGTELEMSESEISGIHHRIAMEWDEIESHLQNDEFWLFIKKEYDAKEDEKMPARIEYLFTLICRMDPPSEGKLPYKYYEDIFKNKRYELEEKKNSQESELKLEAYDKEWVISLWNKVKSIYQILDEWYYNPTTYHYIGYLITVGNDLVETENLIKLWQDTKNINKNNFINELIEKITEHLQTKYKYLKEPDEKINLMKQPFDVDMDGVKSIKKTQVSDLLLLHNVETVLRRNDYLKNNKKYNLPNFEKFEFHLYKREKYNIEHIRPNSEDKFDSLDDIELYLKYAKISGLDLSDAKMSEIDDFLNKIRNGSSKEGLIDVFKNKILPYFKDGEDYITELEKNYIWNFTLLDESTNKGYGNYIFPVKRTYLIEKEKGYKIAPSSAAKYIGNSDVVTMEKEATDTETIPFVPPCTRYIFTKYYSVKPTSFIEWTKEDAKSYLANMEELLEKFNVKKSSI